MVTPPYGWFIGHCLFIGRAGGVEPRPYERLSNCDYINLPMSAGIGAMMCSSSFVRGWRSHSS